MLDRLRARLAALAPLQARPPEAKASRTGPLIALQGQGRAVQSGPGMDVDDPQDAQHARDAYGGGEAAILTLGRRAGNEGLQGLPCGLGPVMPDETGFAGDSGPKFGGPKLREGAADARSRSLLCSRARDGDRPTTAWRCRSSWRRRWAQSAG